MNHVCVLPIHVTIVNCSFDLGYVRYFRSFFPVSNVRYVDVATEINQREIALVQNIACSLSLETIVLL